MVKSSLLGLLTLSGLFSSFACSRESPVEPPAGAEASATPRQIVDAVHARLPAAVLAGDVAVVSPDLRVEGRGFRARLPERAGAPLRIAVDDRHYLEVQLSGQSAASATRVGASVALLDVAPATDVVYFALADRIEEVRWLRGPSAPRELRYRLGKGPGITTLRLREGRLEALDDRGSAWLRSAPMVAFDADRKELPVESRLEGDELVVTLSLPATARFPIALDPAWSSAAAMITQRLDHTAHRLASGKVLVVGGRSVDTPYATTEIYDPVSATWTAAASMKTPRWRHISGALPDGRIVVAGGYTTGGAITPTTEIYDPAKDTWTSAGNMTTTYVGRMAAVQPKTGRLVSFGGTDGVFAVTGGAQVFDGTTWIAGPGLVSPRANGAAVAISSAEIMVCGGGTAATIQTCEIWSGDGSAAKNSAPMLVARRWFQMALVASGTKVIAAGGSPGTDELVGSQGAEIYDVATGAWSKLPDMLAAHGAETLTELPDGRLLVVGGQTSNTDVYDLVKGSWSSGGGLLNPRLFHTTTVLPDGRALLVGGRTTGSSYAIPQAPLLFADGLLPGVTCTAPGDCKSGVCSDGVCCDRACSGACEACNEVGAVGTCKIVAGVPRTGHASCGGSGPCASSCDGVSATCSFPGATKACVAPSCAGGLSQPGAVCDGAGACGVLLPAVTCAPFVCDATGCKTSCTGDADCVATHQCASSVCVPRGATGPELPGKLPEKPTVTASAQRCTKSSQCSTGFCVQGVCCDTACKDKCHSCVLPSSPGKCTVEPIGVDLKNECGPALSCLGTCDGRGACIGGLAGSMCAPNRCTGQSTGVGPAYCKAPGGTCPTDDTVTFDCALYACDPAFGACFDTCTDSSQCARGAACDLATKSCVDGSAPTSDGCHATPGQGGGSAVLFLGCAALGLHRRRRRARSPARATSPTGTGTASGRASGS